jgi:hypothetical protein
MATKRETPRAPGVRASAVIKWCAFGGNDLPAGAPAECKWSQAENAAVWGPPGADAEMWAWDAATLAAQYEAHREAVDQIAARAGLTEPWCRQAIVELREQER